MSALGYLQKTARTQWLPRWFELRLLSISGFMPELYACVDCGGGLVQGDHVFSSERGGVVCPDCRAGGSDVLLPASEGIIKLLRFLHTAEWETAERWQINEEMSRQTARVLRAHMRYVLDHSIRSIAFLDEVNRAAGDRWLGIAGASGIEFPANPVRHYGLVRIVGKYVNLDTDIGVNGGRQARGLPPTREKA